MRAGRRQHAGDEVGHRSAVGQGNAGFAAAPGVEPVHPGVEDQRLRRVHRHRAVPAFQQRLRLRRRRPAAAGRRAMPAAPARAKLLTTSVCMRAKSAAVWRSDASSNARTRRARQSPNQSRPRNTGKSGGRDALVGVDQPAAGGRDVVRQLLARRPADPVMRAVARHRRGSVAGAADRHPAGDVQRDGLRGPPPAGSAPASLFPPPPRPPAAPSAHGSARTVRRRRCRPGARLAIDTARIGPLRPCRSLITGPWRVVAHGQELVRPGRGP